MERRVAVKKIVNRRGSVTLDIDNSLLFVGFGCGCLTMMFGGFDYCVVWICDRNEYFDYWGESTSL